MFCSSNFNYASYIRYNLYIYCPSGGSVFIWRVLVLGCSLEPPMGAYNSLLRLGVSECRKQIRFILIKDLYKKM